MPALTVDRLRKSYGTRVVFDGVSFSIEEGEKVGFIGVNGSGKSTLFRIVAGEEGSEGGTLAYRRGLSVGSLAQDPSFDEGDTILAAVAGGRPELLDAIAEYHEVALALTSSSPDEDLERLVARQGAAMERIDALGGWDYEHRLEAVLTRLGVDGWDRPVGMLSGGERKRVALARVLVQQPDLLLLDEPTNHLDADTTEWLEDALLDYPGAVMLITHDRYFLDRVVTRMIEVNRAELVPFPGGFTEYLEAKAEREERLAVAEEKRSKLIAQELAWVKRAPSARTGKQKARIHRLDRTRREQELERLPERDAVELKFGRPPRLGRTVLDLEALTKSYDGRPLIRDFSTQLRAGERIGIVGPNGAGKTTLLRMILGEESPDAGRVKPGVNTRIAYYDQARSDLDPDADLLESVAGRQDWVEVEGRRVHVRSYLNSYLFPNEIHEQKVRSLSGGEKNRLLLARLLLQDANLLILDEPTNDLDVFTLQVLESALVEFPGCVLVVTHDRYFLDKVATALFVFEGDGRVHRHEGGYDAYRRRREAAVREAAERAAASGPAGGGQARPSAGKGASSASPARPRRLTYAEQQELEGIEAQITAAEAERDRLEAVLGDPALYSDAPGTVPAITAEFEDARRRVDLLYARWGELDAVRDRPGA
ncbi:MAG: ABC-F family ATP-binding cassette domain-containing protein [Gemmatimonadetes bacterium]|nr:ABC-F family ATP-binding cassette domain-containing protein [Gemmatimonadota bacterium]